MNSRRLLLFSALALWLAVGIDVGLSGRRLFGAPLGVTLLVLGVLPFLTRDRKQGTVMGFCAGLLVGALAGSGMAVSVTSRTVAGFVGGWLGETGIRFSKLIVAVVAGGVVVLVQLVMLVAAPPPELIAFLGDTIRTAMVNGALAIPLHALLARLLDPEKRWARRNTP